jgi:hypothetical protein
VNGDADEEKPPVPVFEVLIWAGKRQDFQASKNLISEKKIPRITCQTLRGIPGIINEFQADALL